MSKRTGGIWQDLAEQMVAAEIRVREEIARQKRSLLGPCPSDGVAVSVRELYQLRGLIDDLIDSEIIRGKEAGMSFDLLGSSRQQAQQRYRRAVAKRQQSATAKIGNDVADLVNVR